MLETDCFCSVSKSCPTPCGPLWTVARQAPLPTGFSRQEYRSGLPCPPPGDLPNPETESSSLKSPALAGRFFTTNATYYYYSHFAEVENGSIERLGKLSKVARFVSCNKFPNITSNHLIYSPKWPFRWLELGFQPSLSDSEALHCTMMDFISKPNYNNKCDATNITVH